MSPDIVSLHDELTDRDISSSAQQICDLVQRRLPDPKQQQQYWDYVQQKAIQDLESFSRTHPTIDQAEFRRIINTERLSSESLYPVLT